MKTLLKLSVPIVVFLLLSGCTTTVLWDGPGKSSTTLVVGRLELHARNFRSYRSADINGTHSMGVEIYLIDIVHNNRTVLQSSGDDGLFYSTKLEPGQYKIEKFRFKRNSSNWGAVSIWFRPKENNSMVIQSGSVNNLGLVKWYAKNFTTKSQSDGRGSPTGVKLSLIHI